MENFNVNLFLSEIAHFTGTELYYKHGLTKVKYTDGVHFMAEECQAHWLIDFIALRVTNKKEFPELTNEEFLCVRIICHDSQAIVSFDNGNYRVVYSEVVDFTDFPLNYFKMYYENGVLCLPTER